MKKEDKQVQTALAKAGYEGWPAGSRGELFETLARIRRQYHWLAKILLISSVRS
ncbi:hypothetical protein K1567_27375 [Pseudomonas sp. S5F11]|uniref:hypothetical protein n=1 Tax=Pseudomonas sp. S5F11 TaxID=2866385 RepID=UPI001C7CA65A|nr:hypothetical protein [Pseudomonas sp. S5F11]MBX4139611.1 hypothetical protein [Pseudomonas sp. S5F11]